MTLVTEINNLRNSETALVVNQRLSEFENLGRKGNDEWFSELCFCILTANSKAETALNIQKELGYNGFCSLSREKISSCIRENKHRFHNNKARFIVGARENLDIKSKLKDLGEVEAREFLVENIKGLGYKEASHFLRNVGKKNLAILDRHILNLMVKNKIIDEKPKSLNKKNYLEIEKKFNELARKVNMSPAELDLYLWSMKTGKVLK